MKSKLKMAMEAEAVPADLDGRIRASIEGVGGGGRWFAPAWGVAAAAAVLLVGFVGMRRSENKTIANFTSRVSALMSVGLADHLHCTMLRRQRAEPVSLETMKLQLGATYAALIPAVEAHVPRNYRVLDAHQCRTRDREFVHLVMNYTDHYISVIVARRTPGETFSTQNLTSSLAQAGIPFYQQGSGNFQIAGFESGGHLVYLVSDLAAAQNQELMVAMAGDLKRALPAL